MSSNELSANDDHVQERDESLRDLRVFAKTKRTGLSPIEILAEVFSVEAG
ncbi:hypothetical protein SNOG_06651 [Parastagonospora nodorum SN15]|uniref:Uncharacterized protein n=1 Tax=Phaeosphaeria nodorum (strain SN15 / ATCC MYA-4574 / FGSC 10173) TaxID=321614 RepID=Q0UNL3_PHANO|nr:hypothetical protein SNOG_06651 [Parastagonospora nodorum SN15]EAT86482.1 hypothetical protein SNOG_06651 [Parastagonospora nodorum SN15]